MWILVQIRPTALVRSQDPCVAFLYGIDHAVNSINSVLFQALFVGGVCLVPDLMQALQPVHPSPRCESSWRTHAQLGFHEIRTTLAKRAWAVIPGNV
jgi:hypothetical protein